MARITGFAAREKNAPVVCDAYGNNVAFQCRCGAPVLAVILENQRGSDSEHPTTCPGCRAKFWLSVQETDAVLVVHPA
jgi:hypothetical protein